MDESPSATTAVVVVVVVATAVSIRVWVLILGKNNGVEVSYQSYQVEPERFTPEEIQEKADTGKTYSVAQRLCD